MRAARRAIATALFGAVAIMAFRAMVTPGAGALDYLTGALTFATAVYGWFTSEMVAEMQAAREADVAPILVPYVKIVDQEKNQGWWGIKNVGRGPALGVNVTLSYGEEYGSYRFTLESTVLGPGEEVFAHRKFHADLWRGRTFSLKGTCQDVHRMTHAVDVSVSANAGWTPTVNRDNPVDEFGQPVPRRTQATEEEAYWKMPK